MTRVLILLVILSTSAATKTSAKELPKVFLLNAQRLESTKQRIASGDKETEVALKRLLNDAEKALSAGPFSVTSKTVTPPSGDKRDYMSQAPYFWPDPKSPSGLPYIRRDGERNPEINKIDNHRVLDQMEDAVETLALAYYFQRDEKYASKAAELLRTFFLNSDTRMNPNLQYAQGIPGINTGRGIGLIETRGLTRVVDAIGLLNGSKAWTTSDQRGLQDWFAQFLKWMLESKNGKDEAAAKNNHGTYYDLQVVSFALFLRQESFARQVLEAAKQKRIALQIEPDGRQPLELERTRGWGYSVGNLDGLMSLARLGENVDVDLWNFKTRDGRSIRQALNFLIPFAVGEKKWPYQQLGEWPPQMLFPLMRRAAEKYDDTQLKVSVSKLPPIEASDRQQLLSQLVSTALLNETEAQRDQRMRWWREARFGMFIHWGLYAVPAGEYNGKRSERIGEWIMEWANIPRVEYEKFAPQFNPVQFDAKEWVRTAKDAGMKYIVITSKHHDGFALYDSKVSNYDIVDATPYHKDPIKALATEAKKQGLKFCFYYSILDWHHPTAYVDTPGKDPTAGNRTTKLKPGGKEEYLKYMQEQLRELITTYDPAVLWFDGEWQEWWTEADGKELYKFVRTLKPDIIINNRVGRGRQGMQGMSKTDQEYAGDFGTPEQQIPANGLPGVDWESCMTMNTTWGFKFYDDKWKSSQVLIRNLIDIASKGGNYLLNVGPTKEGFIPAQSVERLSEIGRWMKVNGESIYGTTASPFANQLSFGRATSKPGRIYLHVFEWPQDGNLRVPSFGKKVRKAYLLGSPKQQLKSNQDDDGISVTVPAQAPDRIATVIVLETN